MEINSLAATKLRGAPIARLRTTTAEHISREEQLNQLERRLRAGWRRLRKAEQVSRLGSWEMDITTGESIWSDEFYRICGLVPGAVPATAEEGFKLIHPDDRERAAREVTRAIESGGNYSIEKRIVRPSGEIRHIHSVGEVMHDADGRPERLMGSFLDITERKEAEERLRRTLAELQKSNAELDAFASTVAHDLRTPLGLITGFGRVISDALEGDQPEEVKTALEVICRTGQKMVGIVDSLLLLASVRHLEDIDIGPVNMEAAVTNSLSRLALMVAEYEAHVTVPTSWPSALGYGPWIEEVWTNYVSNALKYGGRPPQIELGADEGEEQVRFWVRDNGEGVAPEQQRRIFTKFSRAACQSIDGHGLGLSIVHRIVEKLGGEVGVESEPGAGSLFYFTLPRPGVSGCTTIAERPTETD